MPAILVLSLLSCATEEAPWASAQVMDTLADGIGGEKALARPGDIVLENDRVRVAITQGGNSMGPSLFGGSLIDADLQRSDPALQRGQGNDRLAEIFPTVNMNVMYAVGEEDVQILADGSDGNAAVVRVAARHEPFLALLAGLWQITGAPFFNMSTDYVLEPGASWVTIETTAYGWAVTEAALQDPWDSLPDSPTLLASSPDLPLLDYAITTGASFGDFYLQGGSVNVFAPGMGFDEDGAVQEATEEGRNSFQEPFELDFVAGTADGVSYGLAALDGPLYVPLFTSSQTAGFGAGIEGDGSDLRFNPAEAFTYRRVFVVGEGDVGSVLDGILEARGAATGRVEGHVLTEGSLEPASGVFVFVYVPGEDKPFSQWETDVSWSDEVPDGSFGGQLPPGDWELQVHEALNGTGPRIPVTVAESQTLDLSLLAPRSGRVEVEVVDEYGVTVPSKLTVFRDDGLEVVRDPVLGDGFIAGEPEAVIFNPFGETSFRLPAGDYVMYATRGIEYELGVQRFSVSGTAPVDLQLQVARTVDTSGWVSADFHVHSNPSHDSGISPETRVGTMVSEHVEFLVSSDHDFVTDFRPVIEDLSLEPWIASAVGVEVTTVEAGHYIGFPLDHDYLAHAGGALDWTGETPDEMLAGIEQIADVDIAQPVRFVAHPRDGILGYFDQYGFSPYGGTEGSPLIEPSLLVLTNQLLLPANFTLEFEALELLNGKRFDFLRTPTQEELDAWAAGEEVSGYEIMERTAAEQELLQTDELFRLGYGQHGQIDDWFTLLNLGYRHTAIGNSDTHGTTSTEAGCPRNYVLSSTDDPGYLSAAEIAENVAAGHVITSYGPFLRFEADGEAIVGDEHVPAGSEVEFYLEVQSPSWFDVERVELYRNGVLVEEWAIETPNADVLNLAETWTDSPDQDSWYVLIAMGSDSLEPLFTPVVHEPVELQEVVTEALSSVEAVSSLLSPAVPEPRTFPVYPFALTNPIYVDLDGNGFDAPGVPDFMLNTPVDPNEESDEGEEE